MYQFIPPYIKCVVILPQKISNMGIISNVNNLTRSGDHEVEMWWKML